MKTSGKLASPALRPAPSQFTRVRLTWVLARCFAFIASVLTLAPDAKAQGIPEPNLVIYGVVNNPAGNRISFGTLNWTFRPVGGGADIVLTTTLTNINDQFSYVLRVPCETEIPGVALSAGTLKLAVALTRYDRAQVTIEGVTATFKQPDLSILVLARTDRGRIERIDLVADLAGGTELPEAWQLQYFGRTGINASDDPDRDGLNNLAEFKAGTDPTDAQSVFEIINVLEDSVGGVRVEWSSVATKIYTLQRSDDLLSGFSNLQTGIAATPPRNSLRDASATGSGPYFYRLRIQE